MKNFSDMFKLLENTENKISTNILIENQLEEIPEEPEQIPQQQSEQVQPQ